MAFIPALNTVEIALSFTDYTGDENINKFNVQNSVPWTAGTLLSMMDQFEDWFAVGDGGGGHTYQKLMSNTCSLVAVKGRDLTTVSGISLVTNIDLPQAGTVAGPAVAAGTTKAITHRTGLAGKSFRGRTFLAGVDAAHVPIPESGKIDASYCSNAVLAFTSLIAAVTTELATATLVVLSRYGGVAPVGGHSVPRATGVMTPIIAFGYADLNVDFQRRRAPGHSRHR
jgi:hypothetical protein